jgi:hypothetical protein
MNSLANGVVAPRTISTSAKGMTQVQECRNSHIMAITQGKYESTIEGSLDAIEVAKETKNMSNVMLV